jgi:sulfoxide reductase heme-binding subunit YedZ
VGIWSLQRYEKRSRWIRRLGGRNWNRLHKLVYATAMIAALHYWWLVKSDVRRPLAYAGVVLILLAARAHKASVRRVLEYSKGATQLSSA